MPPDLPYLTLEEVKPKYPLNDSQIIRLAEDNQLDLLTFVKYRDINSSLTPSELVEGLQSGCLLTIPPKKVRELLETGEAAIERFFVPDLSLIEPDAQRILFGIIGDFPSPGEELRPKDEEAAKIMIIDKDDVVVSRKAVEKLFQEPDFPFVTITEAAKITGQEIDVFLRKGISRAIDLYYTFSLEKIEVGRLRVAPTEDNTEGREYYRDQGDYAVSLHHRSLPELKKFARMIRSHQELILNYFRAKKEFSSGIVEGFNNKAKLTIRKSYGFRSDNFPEIALYHTLGDLPVPEITHRFV